MSKKFSTATNLGDEINIFLTLEILIKFEHVWMIKLNENIDLLPELFLILDLTLRDNFDRSDKAEFPVEALENGTESAFTELFLRYFVDFSHVFSVFHDHGLLAEVQTRLLVALNRRR